MAVYVGQCEKRAWTSYTNAMGKVLFRRKGPFLELNRSSIIKGNFFFWSESWKLTDSIIVLWAGRQPHSTVLRKRCDSGGDVGSFLVGLFCFLSTSGEITVECHVQFWHQCFRRDAEKFGNASEKGHENDCGSGKVQERKKNCISENMLSLHRENFAEDAYR